jgi:hypothetical protein
MTDYDGRESRLTVAAKDCKFWKFGKFKCCVERICTGWLATKDDMCLNCSLTAVLIGINVDA